MPTVALTDRFCSTAKPQNGRTDYFDETVQGLALRVTEQGHRSGAFTTDPRATARGHGRR